MGAKVHFKQVDFWVIDSTPQVGPNPRYCARIGFTDGRQFCPIRPEGAADRVACENWRVGRAKDTGRPGPTWTRRSKAGQTTFCSGVDAGCIHHPENRYQVLALTGGLYEACVANGVCGSVDVERGL